MVKSDTYNKLTRRVVTLTPREVLDMLEAKYPELKPNPPYGWREEVSVRHGEDTNSIVIEYIFTEPF